MTTPNPAIWLPPGVQLPEGFTWPEGFALSPPPSQGGYDAMAPGAITAVIMEMAQAGPLPLDWVDDALGYILNWAFGDITRTAYSHLRDWLIDKVRTADRVRFPPVDDETARWRVWDYWGMIPQLGFYAVWGALIEGFNWAYAQLLIPALRGFHALGDAIGNLFSWLRSGLLDRLSTLWTDIDSALSSWGGNITGNLISGWASIQGWVNGLGTNIHNLLFGYTDAAGRFHPGLQQNIGATLDGLGTNVNRWLFGYTDEAGEFHPGLQQNIGDTLGDLRGTLDHIHDTQLPLLLATSGAIDETLSADVAPQVAVIAEALQAVPAGEEPPEDRLEQIWRAQKDLLQSQAFDPWTDWLQALRTTVAGIPSGIGTAIGDTLGGLGTTIANLMPAVDLTALQDLTGFIGDAAGSLVDTIISPLLSPLFPPPSGSPWGPGEAAALAITPETSPGYSLLAGLLRTSGTVIGTLTAFTIAAELIHPFKQWGLAQLSAIIWDITQYRAVIAAAITTITGASTIQPLRYAINALYQPYIIRESDAATLRLRGKIDLNTYHTLLSYQGYNQEQADFLINAHRELPSAPDITMMYAKKEITEETFDRWMGQYGIEAEYLDVYHRYIWLDPRLGELIRISQIYRPSGAMPEIARVWLRNAGITLSAEDEADWWYWYKIAKAGYETVDIPVLVDVAKMAIARREQTLYFGAVMRLRRDGYISAERSQTMIADGWVARRPEAFRALALETTYDYYQHALISDTVLRAYSRGLYTEADAIDALGDLGLDPQRIQLLVLREKMGLTPRLRWEIPEEEEEALPVAAE